MADNSRAESVRRVVELTGLGIAATYFLDPERGPARRRAALAAVTRRRGRPEAREPGPIATATPGLEPLVAHEDPRAPTAPPEELLLVTTDQLQTPASARDEVQWPTWGWALVITITLSAIAAFAAVGLGIWAIDHRAATTTTTTRTVTVADVNAAPVLADPTARRVVGTAPQGAIILRLDHMGAALVASGLPELKPGRLYRVWLSSAGMTTAVGEFDKRRTILALRPLAPGSRVAITREAAGSTVAAPRGPQVATTTVP
jgi:hypothetical protein